MPIREAVHGYRNLAAAILLQAVVDAQAGDLPAQGWLHSDDAGSLMECLDLNPQAVRLRIARDTDLPEYGFPARGAVDGATDRCPFAPA